MTDSRQQAIERVCREAWTAGASDRGSDWKEWWLAHRAGILAALSHPPESSEDEREWWFIKGFEAASLREAEALQQAYERDVQGPCRPNNPANRAWHREGFKAGWKAHAAALSPESSQGRPGFCEHFIESGEWGGTYCKLLAGHDGEHSAHYPPESSQQAEGGLCGRVLVGQGDDTYDPLCVLPAGHSGSCRPQQAEQPCAFCGAPAGYAPAGPCPDHPVQAEQPKGERECEHDWRIPPNAKHYADMRQSVEVRCIICGATRTHPQRELAAEARRNADPRNWPKPSSPQPQGDEGRADGP